MHRDLKPANVMLKSNGAVKISDFGISSQLDSTAAHCSTFVGTTCYMSPERLSGEHYNYTADIWAFGMILLELACGKYPYLEADSYFKLLEQIMDGPVSTAGVEPVWKGLGAQTVASDTPMRDVGHSDRAVCTSSSCAIARPCLAGAQRARGGGLLGGLR